MTPATSRPTRFSRVITRLQQDLRVGPYRLPPGLPPTDPRHRQPRCGPRALSKLQIERGKALRRLGWTFKRVARVVGAPESTVRKWCR